MRSSTARNSESPVLNPLELEGVLLNRLSSLGQKTYADSLGISESTVSRRKGEGYFAQMAKELSILGLQIVPPEAVVVPRNYLQSVETLAGIGLRAGPCCRYRCKTGPPADVNLTHPG